VNPSLTSALDPS